MSLYKRYVPPKPDTGSIVSATPSTPQAVVTHTPTQSESEKKRKRERTQEEIAERKAKKLKKKGIDPESVQLNEPVPDASVQSFQQPVHDSAVSTRAKSEFAHITNGTKRRKAEKDARAARKAAQKESKLVERGGTEDHNGDTLSTSQPREEKENLRAPEPIYEEPERDNGRPSDVCHNETKERRAVQPLPQPDTKATSNQPKKRRHKLEAVLADGKADDSIPDDEHLRKHTSVLGKYQKSAQRPSTQPEQVESDKSAIQQPVVKDLSIPEPNIDDALEPAEDSALPAWLANPTVISSDSKATFDDLGLESHTVARLTKLSFRDALPVQQVLAPLLLPPGLAGSKYLPGTEEALPDIAVSAPTGSGKTISYLLPIVEALRQTRERGRLSALIVVPTRELVVQVAAVAEALSKGGGIKVGMSTGNGKFTDEQARLIKRGQRYDPGEYERLMAQARLRVFPPDEGSEDFDDWLHSAAADDAKTEKRIEDTVLGLVDHVPTYESAVEILVATPGRLLEHLNHTIGFNLVYLKWLIIDEADKLLDNQYEGFLDTLNAELDRPRTAEEQTPRERLLRSRKLWEERRERRVRKVILSATMTRDISKLTNLALKRPMLVVVRGDQDAQDSVAGANHDTEQLIGSVRQSADVFELPRSLAEYCVPVGDGSEKPLIAVELLRSRLLGSEATTITAKPDTEHESNADSDSDSDSGSDSDDSSSVSSESSDSSTSSSSASDSSAEEAEEVEAMDMDVVTPRTTLPQSSATPPVPTVLVFTSSNESATRLSHLIHHIKPEWSSWTTTLVKSGKARIRSQPTEPAIVISTDRAARGLDSINHRPITHVLQYDVPRSLTSYIHRVGRTARAGNKGDAWTLYTNAEARWFVNTVTKAGNVRRVGEVERVKVFSEDRGLRNLYLDTLKEMREEVLGAGPAGGK
jgi:ATP-dependent RNA helicase DDX51/DBP6